MAEGTYEYECMRAELLNIEKPDYEEWLKNKQATCPEPTEEESELQNLREAQATNEPLKRISGGLDELSSILQVTQKKINKFKVSCGSLTNLLKIKIGSVSSGSNDLEGDVKNGTETNEDSAVEAIETNGSDNNGIEESTVEGGPRKSDLARALDNHVDKIDVLLEKADNAQYSMAHQTKEMKRFLR